MYSAGNSLIMATHINIYLTALQACGTEKHKPFIARAIKYDDIGCFALTELGHGSSAKNMMTTAGYDEKTNEFIINTPGEFAMKWWIGAG